MNTDPERDDEIGGINRLKQNSGQTAEGAAGLAEDAQQKLSGMMGAAKEKLGQVGESAKSAATAARQRAGEIYEDARETAHDVYDRARERVSVWGEDGLQYVRENPATAMATALLAGVVLGFTLRRH